MDIAESRLSAMESIGENLLRADNILKNEDRGIISDIYDLYKNFMNDDLSSRNVSYASQMRLPGCWRLTVPMPGC